MTSRVDWQQRWPVPTAPRPIVIIGAGAIVRAAHLVAYRALDLPVAGLFDIRSDAAEEVARDFDVPAVYESLDTALAVDGAVFDLAVPGKAILGVLRGIPRGSAVLIQKPMGETLDEARAIRDACRDRDLTAAMNFQLRFCPNMLVIRQLLAARSLGTVTDIDVRVVIDQPWHLWPFLKETPRLEVLYHSIHYLDLIRDWFGEPRGVHCRGVGHPDLDGFTDTRSSIILDYGDALRCSLVLNHTHRRGPKHRASELMIEGREGAVRATMGVNLRYPDGKPDQLEVALGSEDWRGIPLVGSWFPDAFGGPMSNLQRFVAGEDDELRTSVDDAIRTMAIVEACYRSSEAGGTPLPETT